MIKFPNDTVEVPPSPVTRICVLCKKNKIEWKANPRHCTACTSQPGYRATKIKKWKPPTARINVLKALWWKRNQACQTS